MACSWINPSFEFPQIRIEREKHNATAKRGEREGEEREERQGSGRRVWREDQ
jgi:hypothetical protein